MSYMDRLAGTTRTNAPVVVVSRQEWTNRLIHDSSHEDDASFRATRSLMHNRTGVCG